MDETVERVAAARRGDRSALDELVAGHRAELHAFCYRMTGSYDEAGELLDATVAEAHHVHATIEDTTTYRVWLYRVAAAVCVRQLAGVRRKPVDVGLPNPPGPTRTPVSVVTTPWLQPYPDVLIGEAVAQVAAAARSSRQERAEAAARTTLDLAYVSAAQRVNPHARAALLTRDVLALSVVQSAEVLDVVPGSANSAVQRARPAVAAFLPRQRGDWAPAASAAADATGPDAAAVRAYAAAFEHADADRLVAAVRHDVRAGYEPGAGGNTTGRPIWFQGSEILVLALVPAFRGRDRHEFRTRFTGANGRPAVALYTRRAGRTGRFGAFGLAVLDVTGGRVAEVSVFPPSVNAAFGLPAQVR